MHKINGNNSGQQKKLAFSALARSYHGLTSYDWGGETLPHKKNGHHNSLYQTYTMTNANNK